MLKSPHLNPEERWLTSLPGYQRIPSLLSAVLPSDMPLTLQDSILWHGLRTQDKVEVEEREKWVQNP